MKFLSAAFTIALILGTSASRAAETCSSELGGEKVAPKRVRVLVESVDVILGLKKRMDSLPVDQAKLVALTPSEKEIYLFAPATFFKEAQTTLAETLKTVFASGKVKEEDIQSLRKLSADIESSYANATQANSSISVYASMELLVKTLIFREHTAALELNLEKSGELSQELNRLKKLDVAQGVDEGLYEIFKNYDRSGYLPVPVRGAFSIADFNRLLGLKLSPMSYSNKSINFVDDISFTPYYIFFHDVNHIGGYHEIANRPFWEFVIKFVDSLPPVEQAAAHALIFRDVHETNVSSPSGAFVIPEYKVLRRDPNSVQLAYFSLINRLKKEQFWGFKDLSSEADLMPVFQSVGQKLGDAVDQYLKTHPVP